MSFAGRRRGNKVKKGVQFTLMVVGASLSIYVYLVMNVHCSLALVVFSVPKLGILIVLVALGLVSVWSRWM